MSRYHFGSTQVGADLGIPSGPSAEAIAKARRELEEARVAKARQTALREIEEARVAKARQTALREIEEARLAKAAHEARSKGTLPPTSGPITMQTAGQSNLPKILLGLGLAAGVIYLARRRK